jgi:hypothetical protein
MMAQGKVRDLWAAHTAGQQIIVVVTGPKKRRGASAAFLVRATTRPQC